MIVGFLDLYRDVMIHKIEGLSEEQARFRPTPGANSLLNLIVHLTGVERNWFQSVIAGPNIRRDRESEFGDIALSVDDAIAEYRKACAGSNEIIGRYEVDSSCDGEPGYSVRWVLQHMLEETARHAGHADITRELIDGAVGFSRYEAE